MISMFPKLLYNIRTDARVKIFNEFAIEFLTPHFFYLFYRKIAIAQCIFNSVYHIRGVILVVRYVSAVEM